MGALADCELVKSALLGQPANTITTLAFMIGGLVVAQRPRLRWIGAALFATGIGSFLFHGPMPPRAEWAHDTTLVWLILVIAGWNRPWERWTLLPGLTVLGVAFLAAPLIADPVGVGLTVAALGLLLIPDRSFGNWGPMALLGLAAVIGRLGATGGPLCNPESLFQPHALWHIASATAVVWWALARPRFDERE
jgi:hypothetical protein